MSALGRRQRTGSGRTGSGRPAGGGAARAARRGAWGLARVVMLVAGLVAAAVALGIVLVVLEANRDNAVVDAALDAAKFLAGPFDDVFELDDRKARIAVNWGIAAAVYLLAGTVVAHLLRR